MSSFTKKSLKAQKAEEVEEVEEVEVVEEGLKDLAIAGGATAEEEEGDEGVDEGVQRV